MRLNRIDLVKIDVEAMEEEVLKGAAESILKHAPIMMIEVLKSNQTNINNILSAAGYQCYPLGYMLLAIHRNDPVLRNVRVENGAFSLGPL
jgi:hypothetical protein